MIGTRVAAGVARLVDAGLPAPVLRAGIRAVCAQRLRQQRGSPGAEEDAHRRLVAELRGDPIAVATEAANRQHYEVPAAFFARVLGPHLKYSACHWPAGVTDLGDAERSMLELTAARAGLGDDQDILDLGCGWGALSLWAAARYPKSRITAVSNSHGQRAFIEARAAERGLGNLRVITGDVRTLALPGGYHRVVSVEMLEHMRNYQALLGRIASWLRPGGALFVHVFAHHRHAYRYEDRGPTDWMAREFFTGGLMPSARLLLHFQDHLRIADTWHLGGEHYARTAEAWYANLVAHRDQAIAILDGDGAGRRRYHRWRVFFLACAEMFGYRGGREWIVAHHRFVAPP